MAITHLYIINIYWQLHTCTSLISKDNYTHVTRYMYYHNKSSGSYTHVPIYHRQYIMRFSHLYLKYHHQYLMTITHLYLNIIINILWQLHRYQMRSTPSDLNIIINVKSSSSSSCLYRLTIPLLEITYTNLKVILYSYLILKKMNERITDS